jgi:DNA-directed RNA polymerase beta' subunit/intein/homing endonuclease
MNMHVPQSVVSMIEISELAGVPTQIISPRECSPILSIEQDVALGVYRMTKKHVTVSEKQLFNMLCGNTNFIGQVPRPVFEKGVIKKWSGRQLLSTIIPKNVNISMPNSSYDKDEVDINDDNYVRIENGEILGGTIDKTIYQKGTFGLVHSIFNEYDPMEAKKFFDNTQTLVCDWLVQSGFSVGISDLIVDDSANNAMKSAIEKMKEQVYDIIANVHANKFENTSIKNNRDYFEDKVQGILSKATDEAAKIGMGKINDIDNRMLNMIKSKSKGKITNVGQMIACLGQNSDEGKRIPYGFENRTLPHFNKYDDGPESRGFVENSFVSGLSPHEFFFHAIGGRGGLIDTAVKSVTGDTPIIIIEDNVPKYVKIGDWIDNTLAVKENEVQYEEFNNLELLHLNNSVYIPTTDYQGNVTWGQVTAMTRHDPGVRLYEIKTLAGKKVIVTESKSLLTWQEDTQEFKEVLTPSIKVGDYVPVTANLAEAPITIKHVDMQEFFPKTHYVYGTEFNKATTMLDKAMEGKERIESGWWAQNNGSSFTLPYTRKAMIDRTRTRSNVEAIHDGCVYPYRGTRGCGHIPSQFTLDYEFGVFIGLYLAEGNTCIRSGNVAITNQDANVQKFVNSWFEKYEIKTSTRSKTNKIGGHTSTVYGYSRMLAMFLDKFVGKCAKNKFVPSIAFVAPEEFVKGLLSGYFTGDGTISKSAVECGSASARLTEGISMLCTRLGIFAKVFTTQTKTNNLGTENIAPSHRLAIRSHWAKKFAETIKLLVPHKQDALNNLVCTEEHRNFQVKNDVVLDKITEINIIGVENYPKMYDLTIPSTLNFGLANGLQVRDTSDVGYLQRKLVKAMEDCKVNHDYTVRNASGSIIQFVYGEDGMDPTKIEDQPLPFTKMDYSKLKKAYLLTEQDNLKYVLEDDVIEGLHSIKDWQKKFEIHFQEIMTDREFVMKNILVKEGGNKIKYPIAFARITTNAKAMFNKYDNGALSDLDPIYALNTINKLCDELYVHEFNKANKFLKMLIRCYLSPKKCIFDYKFDRTAFDYVINQVRQRFYDSIAHPSDMVGVVAAQSLGEPCTQLTLNTFHLSGVASASKAVRGVPRIKELMSVTKNIKTPSMSIRLKEQFAQDDKKSTEVLNNIQTTYFKDLVQSTKVYYDPDDFDTTIEDDRLFVETYKELTNEGLLQKTKLYPWLLRFELDRSAMVEHAVTMLDIYRVLNEYYEDMVHVMFSDDNSKNLIFRIKIEDQGEDKDIITEMKALERSMLDNVIIKGLPKISKVVKNQVPIAKYVPSTMTIESEQQWVLETAGTNMLDVMSMKEVDTTKTISNDIVEIYELLGVEAARQALYNELQSVIGDAGLYVNYRHIALLVDTMTNKGYLLSIDRHGINRTDIGPFAKCSFEETTDMLIKAGIFAEVDKINGVSANTMLGQVPPAGTGDTDVLIDEWKLQDITAEQEATQQDILQAYDVQQELEEEANLDFDFEMPI